MSDHDAILEAKLNVIDETHRYAPGKTALLVIDMQHGFLDEGASLEVAAGREIVPVISQLIDAFRAKEAPVIFTEFVYAENHSEGNCTGSFMIRKGPWKYIHFTWYDDLLFNLSQDPREMNNLANEPSAQAVKKELKEILNSQVDTESLTLNAFKRQEQILNDLVERMSEDELYQLFEFRLGPGQARAMAAKYKGR